MRILFYAGVALWMLFEIANVYFIMPMPFSQRMQTIDAAYFMYTSRWVLRGVFGLMIVASWWRQATGDAMVGPMTGKSLTEIPSQQVTLAQWLALYPNSLIMQPDSALRHKYSTTYDYETGKSRRALTGTDTISWREKAWVVGLSVNGKNKAYDWNRLRRERVISDVLGGKPVLLVLARDSVSFFAFERPDSATQFVLRGDSLVSGSRTFALSGRGQTGTLRALPASQEFWHSWRTFHPDTKRY